MADRFDEKAAELLLCAAISPWCLNDDGTPTGEHYEGISCGARYRRLLSNALRECAEEARAEGWIAAADSLAEPYPPDVAFFAPLTDEQIEAAVAAMGVDISGRLHAGWVRHLADVLRRRAKEQP